MGCGSSKSVETPPPAPSLPPADAEEGRAVKEGKRVEEELKKQEQPEEEEEVQAEEEEEEIELLEEHGTYTPFTDFPTPTLLRQAQDDYRDANVTQDTDQQGVPLPYPPPNRKDEIFNLERSTQADEQTLKVPLSAAELSYNHLADHLTRHCTTDLEKVRSFFVWISSQSVRGVVRYVEGVGLDSIDPASPLFLLAAILVTRRAGSYSHLLASLCREVSIPVRVVQSSLVRGVYREAGSTEEDLRADNTHCIVHVAGAWRIIDQHWGSEGVIAAASPDWELIAGRETIPNSEEEGQLVHRRSEFYFLVDPERYIFQQWCSSLNEQLLARPVTKDEFIQMVFVNRRFFELGFTSIDPTQCMLSTSNGRVLVKLGLPTDKSAYFDYTLLRSKFEEDQNLIDGERLDRYVLGEMTKDYALFHVNLRRYGNHRLQLWAGPDKWHLDVICELRIMCETPDFRHKLLPFSDRAMFGLNPVAKRYNLEAYSAVGGIIQAENGVAILRLVCQSVKSIQVTYDLLNPDFDATHLRNNIRHYFTGSYLVIVAVLPRHGDFLLQVKANEGIYGSIEIGRYLIKSTRRFCYPTPFPKSSGKESQIGDLTQPGGEYLEPLSHVEAIITYEEVEELRISMGVLKPGLKYSAQLLHCSKDLKETNRTEFLFLEYGDDQLDLVLRFCRVGTYKLNVLVDQTVIYQYVIRAMTLTEIIQPYPQRQVKWNNCYRVLEPRIRFLSCNQTIRFRLQVSGVQAVLVEFRGRRIELIRNEDEQEEEGEDVWRGDVQIGQETGDLRISVIDVDDPLRSHLILQYKVADDGTMKQLESETRGLIEQAKRWRESLEREEDRETNEEQDRQREEEEEVRGKESDFQRNKERYKREEKLFVRREGERMEEVKREEFSPEKVKEDIKAEDLQIAKDLETREAARRRPLWQREYDKMKPELAIVRLREAASSRNLDQLRAAIADCKSRKKMEEYEEEIYNAEILLKRLELRQALEEAMESKDVSKIVEMIAEIRQQKYSRRLEQEIRHAENRIDIIRLMSGMNRNFLNMNRVTMMELRSYKLPPPPVHDVMTAFYLVLGEDEGKTKEWKYCVKLCQTQGSSSKNLMYKVANMRAHDLHPEIAARALEILSRVRLQDVRRVSGGAATFYIWTKGVLDEYRKARKPQEEGKSSHRGNGYHDNSYQDNGYSSDDDDEGYDDDDVKPANVTRQREIFNSEESLRRMRLVNLRSKS